MFTAAESQHSTEQLRSRLAFETLISDLSSRFVNLPPSDVDRAIEDALRRVCETLGLDYAVLWQWSGVALDVLVPSHAYPPQEASRAAEPLRQELYPWVIQQVRAGRLVVIPSWEEMPAEAAVDQESALSRGIKSSLVLPLAVGGEAPVGALAFNAIRAQRDWSDALVKRLQLVGQIFTNALARRRHELGLQESEERLAMAADSAGAGLWILDHRTRAIWATERARAIFGYSPDEAVTIDRLEAQVHPDDWDRVREAVERSLRTGEPLRVESRIVLPGGPGVRWVSSRARPYLNAAGELERLIGISLDITERKLAEEEFRRGEARLEAGAALADLAFYEADFGAGVAFFDERLHDLSGVPPERDQGLGPVDFWLEHVHPDDRQRVIDQRQELHEERLERLGIEYRYLHPTRGERWMHHVARVTRRDASGRTLKTFGVIRDITERRQREEALKQSYAEIARLKDRLQAESDYLKAEIKIVQPSGEVTGQSAAIQKVLRLVEQVAPTDSSVLIRGETGSGKELVAQAIHRQSSRRSKLMVKVNCAALPSGLIESELFGREKGAFTGAMTRQVGRFEVADGSTLFLDEIGELSLEVQAKLLRVLEAGEFERLGSPKTIKVDVRVIAATNRDLAEQIKKGRFREDLYYRLNVFPIRVPPLRERAEDIPVLVWAFLEEFSSRMGKKITQVPRRTLEALQRHSWPGNVRELRNVIEHGAILTNGDTLRVPLLEDAARVAAPQPTLADAERELICRALEGTHWHVKGPRGAAAALGLNPSTLYSRMKKLGIRPPERAGDESALPKPPSGRHIDSQT
jgi:formate hydrogenlyase transcriptional activator